MSLPEQAIEPVPEATAQIARKAFPKGNPYIQMRDSLGTIYTDDVFADLYPQDGQPAVRPWRLALVTIMQFAENLADRQAGEAVRDRLAWKYALSLHLMDVDCATCPALHRCIDNHEKRRTLTIMAPQTHYENQQKARQQLQTATFKAACTVRAGVEGTLSQDAEVLGARRSRYRGADKTHLQHLAVAAVINLLRGVNWLNEIPLAKTPRSHFARLVA